MADLYASRAPVRLNDGSADANNAVIGNAAPGASDYALEVRQVGLPAAGVLADATANPTLTQVATFLYGYNGATWDRLKSSTANGLQVDVTRVTGSVTVDTELPNAAALADAAANPTTAIAGAATLLYNGTTWDRAREVVAAQDTAGTGIAAAGILAQLDDVGTSTVTENQFAPLRLSTRRALLIEGVASGNPVIGNITQIGGSALALGQTTKSASLPVTLASDQGNVPISLAASSATVTVDTELPAAAAAADATANPTVPGVGGFLFGYNGTTWDRVRTANMGRLQVDVITGGAGTQYVGDAAATSTPTGTIGMGLANAAAPADVSANNDAVGIWALRNGSQVVNLASGGTLITVGAKTSANSLPVVLASDQAAISVSGSVTADTELAPAVSLADGTANPTVPIVGSALMGWNTATWDRLRSTTANGLVVDVSRVQGTVTTVLATASAMNDAVANPTITTIAAYNMGFNGTTWDRIRTANTGRLQVDVVTGGGAVAASGLPSGYNLIGLYGTSAAVAGGATQTAVVTVTPANTKAFYVRTARVVASGQTKWQIKFGAAVLDTGFNPPTLLSQTVFYDPPLTGTGDGSTALTIDVTNREASAMDVYAALRGWVLA